MARSGLWLSRAKGWIGRTCQQRNRLRRATAPLPTVLWSSSECAFMRLWRILGMPARCPAFLIRILKLHFRLRRVLVPPCRLANLRPQLLLSSGNPVCRATCMIRINQVLLSNWSGLNVAIPEPVLLLMYFQPQAFLKYRARLRVTGFSFIRSHLNPPTKCRSAEPVEHKQRSFNTANFPQCFGKSVF